MRGLLLAILLTGCSFEVPAIGHGPGDFDPAGQPQPPGTSTLPPTSDPPVIDPPAEPTPATNDLGTPTTPTPQNKVIGAACGDQDPCGNNMLCLTKTALGQNIPGGYCSTDCAFSSCPNGAQCSTQWGPIKVCLNSCPADGCRGGYVCCKNNYNPGVCLPGFLCPNSGPGGGGGGPGGGGPGGGD
jgi:hypothetical protein